MPSNVIHMNDHSEAFELGLTTVYRDELKRLPVEYRDILREKKAMHFFDTEWVVSGLGVMPEKTIGGNIPVDRILDGPTKKHGMKTYAVGLVIVYEALRWDLYDVFEPLARELPRSAVDRYNLVAYEFYEQAFTATDTKYKNYQGEAAISATHARLDGGTWSNRLTDDDALSYEGIQEALVLIRRTVNDRGRFVQLKPSVLIVAPEQEWVADTILNSTKRPNEATNDKNTLSGKGLRVHTSNYLTTPQPWFLQCSKRERGFQVCMRLGDSPDLVRDTDNRSRNKLMTSYCSFEFAVFQTRGLVGSSGGA
jgi:phage major head subunit gpT-like protein